MKHMHRHMPALAVYLAAFFTTLLACASVTACSGSARQHTLRASFVAVNAARDGLLAFDKTHQLEIVDKATTREQAEVDIAAYHARRAVVVTLFELTYRAIALAATSSDNPSYAEALKATKALLEAVKALTGGV